MKKDPLHTLDKDDSGRAIVLVPLGEHQGTATLYQEDWRRLIDAGYRGSWFLDSNGTGSQYVKLMHRGRNRRVARLLMDEPSNRVVRYRDRDPTNLRMENLVLSTRLEVREEGRIRKMAAHV